MGLGAAAFSGVWFVLLSSTSSLMKPHLSNPFLMRKIMSASGVLLILLSGKLGMDVVNWMIQDLAWEANALSSMQYPLAPGNLFTTILFKAFLYFRNSWINSLDERCFVISFPKVNIASL